MKHLKKYNEKIDQELVNHIRDILDGELEIGYVPYETDMDGNPFKEITSESKDKAAVMIADLIRSRK